MGQTEILLIVILALSTSGFFLKYVVNFDISKSNLVIPLGSVLLGIAASTQLRDFSEAILFLLAAIGQFAAYVFVSRLRQKGSFFWHAIASLGSNGMWYATGHILKIAEAYWMLFIPYVIGLIGGRILGVGWAQYIETRFKLKSDATRDERLAPGKRINYVVQEPMFWGLVASLAGYVVYAQIFLSTEVVWILIVIGLSILQNFFYAIGTRASQRGHNWYIAITGIMSGVTFAVTAAFLFSKGMPMVLAIPYILSTTLGSTLGAFISMIIEWTLKLKPDAHLEKEINVKETGVNPWKKRLPYLIILSSMGMWIFFQELIFTILGIPVSELKFPISAVTRPVPRVLILLTATLLFFFDSALHTLTSRAGNRNHTGYHVSTLVPKGMVDFFKVSYFAMNSRILDIVPVSVLASCLGSLYGKDISEKIEKWLQARMDIEPVKETRS